MASDLLKIHARPKMQDPRMVIGLSGWMDGGEVSTGTIETLAQKLDAYLLAEIDGEDFYILNFPGSMEMSSLFRPHTKIADGLITAFRGPTNKFYCSEKDNLILFLGKEPNLKWSQYAECLFSMAEQFGVSMIYFIGSVAGLVPHTREPRLFSSVSDASLKADLEQYRVRFSNYEGPASIATYMLRVAGMKAIPMATLVAEIPAYVQGRNHRCIESMVRQLAGMLGLRIKIDDLRALSDKLEQRLDEVIQDQPELRERIAGLEEDYDNDVFDTEMGDLKEWLQKQGIRLD